MSSTNKTTNYELSQFIETDKPGWLTDYNGDMRKLDTALKSVSDVASGASGSLSSLTDRMTAAEGAITTNANDIDALEARADSLEAQAQSQAGTISGIQTEQITQNAGIEAATELGYNLARPYDSASTYAVGAYVLFQNTLYKCITAVSTGEAFDPTKWIAIKATDEIASGGVSTIIALNNNNCVFDNVSITIGSLTNYTLSVFAPDAIISFISKIGKLVVGKLALALNFDNKSVGANSSLKIVGTATTPAIFGEVIGQQSTYQTSLIDDNISGILTLKSDNTIRFDFEYRNNTSSAKTINSCIVVFDLIYVIS